MQVTTSTRPDPEWRQLLSTVEYGTEGLRYVAPDVQTVVEHVGPFGRFVSLRDGDRTVGTFLLVDRPATMLGRPIRLVYRTGLSVAPELGGLGLGAILTGAVRRWLLAQGAVSYGIIDPTNTRSRALAVKAGYRSIGKLRVLPIFNGADHEAVRPVAELDALKARIVASRTGHTLFDAPVSLGAHDLLGWHESGEVVACVQTVPKRVTVTALPGALDPLRRLVDLRDRDVVQMTAIWAVDGAERFVPRLLDAALARHPGAIGVAALDRRDPAHRAVLGQPDHAVSDRLFGGDAELWAGADAPEPTWADWCAAPAWISPLDAC
jgi:hypothetical protein